MAVMGNIYITHYIKEKKNSRGSINNPKGTTVRPVGVFIVCFFFSVTNHADTTTGGAVVRAWRWALCKRQSVDPCWVARTPEQGEVLQTQKK